MSRRKKYLTELSACDILIYVKVGDPQARRGEESLLCREVVIQPA